MVVPSLSLEGKVALVTGSRRGIGQAIALRFAEAKADVAICDLVAGSELDAVAEEIRQFGQRSLAMQVDVRNKASVSNFVQKVEAELGEIDILSNVVGINNLSSLVDLPEEHWDNTFDTNLKGCYLCCQAVARRMIKRQKGSIINIASVDAIMPVPYQVPYNCSKAGVCMLTNTLAFELGRYNIRVNAIAPGLTRAPTAEYLISNPSVKAALLREIAMGRVAEPVEIANVALFLASDLASYVSGATWRVDGAYNCAPLSDMPESA